MKLGLAVTVLSFLCWMQASHAAATLGGSDSSEMGGPQYEHFEGNLCELNFSA